MMQATRTSSAFSVSHLSLISASQHLILTSFSRSETVTYGPIFFPLIYGPIAKRAGHKSTGKDRGSVTYSTNRENEVSRICIISLRLIGRARKETS